MNLKEKIDNDLKDALKGNDTLKLSVLRLIKTAIKNLEIEKRKELSEEDLIQVIEKQAKQRRDSIDQYEKAGRNDLADKEKNELAIIDEYLPEKLTQEEVENAISKIIATLSEEEKKNTGRVMGACMKELKGKADPSLVSKVIREKLGA